ALLVDLTPLRESRDFRMLWASQVGSLIGRQVVIVAMPYQVYVVTRSSLAVGLLSMAQAVAIVAASLSGGGLIDRFDRRRVQLAAKSVGAFMSLGLAFGAVSAAEPVWLIFVFGALGSGAMSLDQAASSATVPRLVSRQLLPAALSLRQVLFQGSAIVGPALGGAAIASLSLPAAYGLDVLGFLPSAVLLARLGDPGRAPGRGHHRGDSGLGLGHHRLRPQRSAALARSCTACIGGCGRPHQRCLPGHHPAADRARHDAGADELLQPHGRHDRASPRRPRGRCGGGGFLAGRVGGLGRSALLSLDRGAGSAQPDAARLPGERAGASADAEQLHREHQRRSGRDRTDTAVAVAQCGRDGQLSPPADAHTADAFVPTLDDLAGAELEAEGVV